MEQTYITAILHRDTKPETNLFYELLPSYSHLIPLNGHISRQQFIDLVKKQYSLEDPRNKAFVQAVEACLWLSLTRHPQHGTGIHF